MLATGLARIGIDGLAISPQGKGHARSERHAVEALAARGEHELVVFVREPIEIESVEVVQVHARPTIAWDLVGLPAAARRHRLDGFLTLSERLPPTGAPPIVVWLFESPVHRIRANRAGRAPLWHRGSDLLTCALWRRSLYRAAHVAFGSRATADDVLADVGPLTSWSVVHPGIAPGFSPGPAPDRDRYVLHLGSNDPRDNTAVAVEAARQAGVRLLVVGGWQGRGAEALGRVSDEELVALYRGASAYLDPTLYEGFGYGVLEAMACGTPVVASNTTSIPEVVGEAGILCDPTSPKQFATALRRVFDDQTLARALRERGLLRASELTWETAGAGLSDALHAALSTAQSRKVEPRGRNTSA